MKKISALILAVLFFVLGYSQLSFAKENISDTIEIAMATDNNYTYQTIVAMTSILENKSKNTFVNFHVMLSEDFDNVNKEKIKSLQNSYSNCCVNILDMNSVPDEAKVSGHVSKAAYFRLNLPNLLPQLEKVLYIDTDIIAMEDISKLYNTNIDDYYIGAMNHASIQRKDTDFFGVGKRNIYVNSGVVLMNLKKIREDDIENKFYQFILDNKDNNDWQQHDQDVINVVCYGKIFILPLRYNAMQHTLCHKSLKFWYGEKEFKESFEKPAIIHFSGNDKPWKNLKMKKADLWWKYAKKTLFYKDIKNNFKKHRY